MKKNKKYKVIFYLVKAVDYETEAENEEEAEDKASSQFSEDYRDTEMDVGNVEVEEIYSIDKEKSKDEFHQLREDDKNFAEQYREDEFEEWFEDQGNIK